MEKTTRSTPVEEYIIDESQELSFGGFDGWIKKFTKAFPAFKHRNYRFFFLGQLVSFIGTWVQMVALGWYVFNVTHSAFLVGVVTALGTLPILLFSLFAGVIIDRFPKKKLLFVANTFFLIFALGFVIIAWLEVNNIWILSILAFCMGVVDAFDKPARHTFISEIVGKEDMSSAIALSASMYNGARIVGPAIAGFIIASLGIGAAFTINAISFVIVLIALSMVKVTEHVSEVHADVLIALKNGVQYAFTHPIIKVILVYVAIVSIFGWSYNTLMPVLAEEVFNENATGLGYLFSASGLGAVCASALISAYSKKYNPFLFILGGSIMFGISAILFSFTSVLWVALCCLFFVGAGLIAIVSMMNSVIQHTVADSVRGRVMSIYILMFIGLTPIGSLQVGFLAEHFGVQFSVRVGAFIVLVVALGLLLKRDYLVNLYHKALTMHV